MMVTQTTWKDWFIDWSWFAAWAIASSAWCLLAAATVGNTFDEQPDLDDALDFWRTGSHYKVLRVGAMPLPLDIASLPIYLHEVQTGEKVDFRTGDPSALLFQARAVLLVFWWLLLVYARLIGRDLGGPWAGRLAVAFIACEPNFLAHASLATKDVAVTACLLAFAYHFANGREAGWWKRVGVPGVWFGIALLAKASALTFAPICMLAIELHRIARGRQALNRQASDETQPPDAVQESLRARLRAAVRPFVRDGIRIGLIGLLITFVYCGTDWQPQDSWVKWANGLPDDATGKSAMVWLAENTRIFSNAGVALARQISHNIRGHGVYILGETDPRAIWYYFPVALAIKLTLPILVLPLLILFVRPRTLANWATIAAAILLVYSLNCRVQIGVRLMLPLVALGIVGLSAGVATAWQDVTAVWKKRLLSGFCLASLLWAMALSIHVWPNGLCYTNELWGGTGRGYLALSDSNYDWGQGVPDLERWRRRHQLQELAVWYFGTDSRLNSMPIEVVSESLTKLPAADFAQCVRGKHLAVSTTLLYGSYTGQQCEVVNYLRSLRPVDRTQTFLIFDFQENQQTTQRAP